MKITGVRSVDFAIEAQGFGSVNDNYTIKYTPYEGPKLSNHSVPKLRGFRWTNADEVRHANEINLKETPLYVSSNKLRNALFKENTFDGMFVTGDKVTKKNTDYGNASNLLCSIAGLVRGYLSANSDDNTFRRASPLFVSDFIDELCNGNFEQFTCHRGEAGNDKTSMFSKTTVGKTLYSGFASLRIEDLQFICLDDKFSRNALPLSSTEQVDDICIRLVTMLKNTAEELNLSELNPGVDYGKFFRKGAVFNTEEKHCEYGILLNNDAIHIIAKDIERRINELNITKAGAFMQVTQVNTHFNKTSRLTVNHRDVTEQEGMNVPEYAVYFQKMGA